MFALGGDSLSVGLEISPLFPNIPSDPLCWNSRGVGVWGENFREKRGTRDRESPPSSAFWFNPFTLYYISYISMICVLYPPTFLFGHK